MLSWKLIPAVALIGISSASGAIVVYDIPVSSTSSDPGPAAPSTSATAITKGAGQFAVSTTSGTAFLESSLSGSTLAQAITGQDYLQFSISVNGPAVLSLTNLVLSQRSEGGAISNFAVFASLSPFTTAPLESAVTGTTTTSSTTYANGTIDLSAPQFQNLTNSTVTFRIYGYDNVDTAGSFSRIDNLTLNGVIPEPSSVFLSFLALPMLLRRKRA